MAVSALRAPLGTLESNWAYMVMASLSWSLKAWLALSLPKVGREKEQDSVERTAYVEAGVSEKTYL